MREIAPLLELRRLAARLGGASDPMGAVRNGFDRAAARAISGAAGGSIVVGMPAACELTFRASGTRTKVFHEVDGHPAYRNSMLETHYGKAAVGEIVPPAIVDKIDRELAAADLILAPSLLVARQLEESGVDSGAILHVPYGVDVRQFDARTESRRPGRPRLIYIGQISFRKGIPTLIAAMRGLNADLEMIGPIVAPELLDRLPSNVRHATTLPHVALTQRLADADAFVIASVEDAFALVVSEALASGLPVITSESVGAAQILRQSDGVVVPVGDAVALREAMSEVAPLSPEDRRRRATEYRERTSRGEAYDWAGYAAAVQNAVSERAIS